MWDRWVRWWRWRASGEWGVAVAAGGVEEEAAVGPPEAEADYAS